MKFKINCSPHLTMHEITKQLFNNKFLADIEFRVGDKIIYAHSLELMKRSVVFEEQFEETLGEKKLIPITDFKYESFLEFIRFIYTDECNINDQNGMDLLKLSTKYRVIMLENRVMNLLNSVSWRLQLFDHCITATYDLARQISNDRFCHNYGIRINDNMFLSLHPDSVNEALKFDQIGEGVTEIQIFNALAGWIENYCKQHQMSLREARERFDDLIKKIRFPTMSSDERRECFQKYPGLLSENDRNTLAAQVTFGESSSDPWISKPREKFISTIEFRNLSRDTLLETKFSVSKEIILCGIMILVEQGKKNDLEIEITAKDNGTSEVEKIQFTQSAPKHWGEMFLSLGDSIELKPGIQYTIAIKFLDLINSNSIRVVCRKPNVNLVYNDPENCIQIIKVAENMMEMMFKPLNCKSE